MVSKVGKVIQEDFLEKVLGPKCAKSGLFSKTRVRIWAKSDQKVDFLLKCRVSVRVRVRVRVSFSRCEMTTFDKPDGGVQGWESDSSPRLGKRFKKNF